MNNREAMIKSLLSCMHYDLREAAEKDLRALLSTQPTAAPVDGWFLPCSSINELQAESITNLISKAKHAHYTNAVLRIGGEDVFFEADWIKHLAVSTNPEDAR